jgi:hypothetical protein
MENHCLVVPFLTDDPAFAHGVEFGILYQRMQQGDEDVIEDCFLLDNQDRILVMASRLGWRAVEMEGWGEGWFRCRLENAPSAAEC